MDRGDRQITSEYIFRGLNFKAVNLACLQKKTKGGAPFLVLEFKGIIVVSCSIWMQFMLVETELCSLVVSVITCMVQSILVIIICSKHYPVELGNR